WQLEFATASVVLYNDEDGDGIDEGDLLADPHKVEVSGVAQFVTGDTFHVPPGTNISFRLRRSGVVGPWQATQFAAGDYVWQLEFATVSVVLYNDEDGDGIDEGDLLADPHKVEVSGVAQFVTGDTFHVPPGANISFRLRRGGVVGSWQATQFAAGDTSWQLEFATVSVVLYNDEAGDGIDQADLLADPHKVEVSGVAQFVTGDTFHVPPGTNISFRLRRGGVVGPWQQRQFDVGDTTWGLEFATVHMGLCESNPIFEVEVSGVGTFSNGDVMHVPPNTNISFRLLRGTGVGAWDTTQFSAGDTTWDIIDDCTNISSIEIIKEASTNWIDTPAGGDVTFTFTINNLSASDAVTIDSLTDSVFDDLNGQGDCACPQTIAAGDPYSCSMTIYVGRNLPHGHTNTVTASGTDDDGIPVSASDEVYIDIGD
ncbi:MAG: hypothetical protein HQ553_08630, partial [Chloroflexi bacterium]|nr:hypothetical protein [Chloroflexota bacterium]